ncbi:hypothetical protein V5P93_004570 [Actinokineospora auranticolor]|nr:hypothetical protein [Actinokineospora auranticolor]
MRAVQVGIAVEDGVIEASFRAERAVAKAMYGIKPCAVEVGRVQELGAPEHREAVALLGGRDSVLECCQGVVVC